MVDSPVLLRSALLRDVRLVPLTGAAPAGPVDVRVRDGQVTEVGPALTRSGEDVQDGGGRWLLPGLWDKHVHLGQWAVTRQRVDVSAARSAPEAAAIVAQHLRTLGERDAWQVVQGFGHRPALWDRQPTAADLDAVCGDAAIVLISNDVHHGWLSTAAFHVLGMAPREGVLEEEDWWPVFGRLAALPGADQMLASGYRQVLREAAELGVVGVVDLEMGEGYRDWPERVAGGLDTLRVRTGVYRHELPGVLDAGHRKGTLLGDSGLIEMGPLKVISDGSLNTRTAYCCEPFTDSPDLDAPHGVQNIGADELQWVMAQAHTAGLESAIHAIGDRALTEALDAFALTGARGSIEHAQLVRHEDISRMADLGVRASVQPAHLWDDRDVIEQCWPDRAERCFAFGSMAAAGVELELGSDAPVARLDPWLAVAAAVHRSADERAAWHPSEALSLRQALLASTDGLGTVGVGHPGDLVLVDANPLDLQGDSRDLADGVRAVRPIMTMVGGRVVHGR